MQHGGEVQQGPRPGQDRGHTAEKWVSLECFGRRIHVASFEAQEGWQWRDFLTADCFSAGIALPHQSDELYCYALKAVASALGRLLCQPEPSLCVPECICWLPGFLYTARQAHFMPVPQ